MHCMTVLCSAFETLSNMHSKRWSAEQPITAKVSFTACFHILWPIFPSATTCLPICVEPVHCLSVTNAPCLKRNLGEINQHQKGPYAFATNSYLMLRMDLHWQKERWKLSMRFILHIQHKLSLLGVHSSLNIYKIFCFVLLYNLSPGLSRMLKEGLYGYLSDPGKFSSALKYRMRSPKPFAAMNMTVFTSCNAFLSNTEQRTVENRKNLDFVFRKRVWGKTYTIFLIGNWVLRYAWSKKLGKFNISLTVFWWDNTHALRKFRYCKYQRCYYAHYRFQ